MEWLVFASDLGNCHKRKLLLRSLFEVKANVDSFAQPFCSCLFLRPGHFKCVLRILIMLVFVLELVLKMSGHIGVHIKLTGKTR